GGSALQLGLLGGTFSLARRQLRASEQFIASSSTGACDTVKTVDPLATVEPITATDSAATLDPAVTPEVSDTVVGERQDPFRSLVDHSPVIAFLKDAEGRYLYTNQLMNELFGGGSGE